MSEWWTYRLEDFLLFSPRVYWRLFELHNAQFWPLHVVMFAAGIAILSLVLRRTRGAGSMVTLMLAVLWIFVGWSFLWDRYMAINWAIAYVVPVFGVQAVLLAIAARRGGLAFNVTDVMARAGLLFATLGVVAYPLLAPVFDRPWAQAEAFGIAPDPTAMVTLGVLMAAGGRSSLLLVPIPLVWLVLSGLTLWTMNDPQGWIALLTAGGAVAALAVRLAPALPATRARSGRHRR